jgi:uncharacterized glyoxalase superfamily protein PhnB
MAKGIPEGYHSVIPVMMFKDTRKAIRFYEKAFGAKQAFLMASPDGKRVMHADILIGNSHIMMSDEYPDQNCLSAETIGNSPISLYVYVENADAVHKQAVEAGATPQMPVQDAFWGDRMGSLKDPFGYSWTMATRVKDLSEQEIAKGAEEFFAQMAHK